MSSEMVFFFFGNTRVFVTLLILEVILLIKLYNSIEFEFMTLKIQIQHTSY
jgi:hypothetical protein